MRFRRLRVANFRGIETSEVIFAESGITLVQGPNEAGKSSLGEAVGLLFDFADSSRHRCVEAVRPVHRDQGPEIELEAETGDYLFTYFKRFHRRPETRLVVSRPRPENHTGREAHERAEAILRETLDLDLWKALTVHQGDAVSLPDLKGQTMLSAALDRAAGGRPTDPREEDLFQRVTREFEKYYTPTGAEKRELSETRRQVEESAVEVSRIEGLLRELDRDVEREAALQREAEALRQAEEQLSAELVAHEAAMEEIARLEQRLRDARSGLELARRTETDARRELELRRERVTAGAQLREQCAEIARTLDQVAPLLEEAEARLRAAAAAAEAAEASMRSAEALASLRRDDFDHLNSRLHLDQLRERRQRIDESRQAAAEAAELLSRLLIDDEKMRSIEAAERELLKAEAQLQAGAPGLSVRALRECELEVDGEPWTLGEGQEKSLAVPDRLTLSVPGLLTIHVSAGVGVDTLNRKVETAAQKLDAACRQAAVPDAESARMALQVRQEAMRRVRTQQGIEQENLRDLTYEELDRKLRGLEQSVPEYLRQRPPSPAPAPDLDRARQERTRSEQARAEAEQQWASARRQLEAARKARDERQARYLELTAQREVRDSDYLHLQEQLDREREVASDQALEERVRMSAEATAAALHGVGSAEADLGDRQPERVRALTATAAGSLRTNQQRRATCETELTEVRTRLRYRGEEGLYEQLQVAESTRERRAAEWASLERRALAAKCLYRTLQDERDRARRAYIAPLRERIEQLGRLVFDPGFEVTVSDDLRISSRTVAGVTVPFESLSGGTREQLSLIFRAACAMIVAGGGAGAPLILDDTLGYTDPERLRLMGVVLDQAAKECQIVIFTCVPDRYRHVGEAKVVSL